MKENFIETRETPAWKRIPITIELGGKKENVWVNYIVQEENYDGVCVECGKTEPMSRESVKEVRVESDNQEIIRQATEKIIELVKRHETKMAYCKDCLPKDFDETKDVRYIKALEEAQDELGIEVDKEQQRKIILEKK